MIDAAEPVTYASIERCIYCGAKRSSDGSALTVEHIVPEALGGKARLPAASCNRCADETSRFERFIAQDALRILRAREGIRGKKRGGKKPVTEGFVHALHGDVWSQQSVNVQDYPLVCNVPVLGRLRIAECHGRDHGELITMRCVAPPPVIDIDELREALGADRIEAEIGIANEARFFHLISKIALAYAFAELGAEGFYPAIGRRIVGLAKSRYLLDNVVGCYPLEDPSELRHVLSLEHEEHNGRTLVVVSVWIFADLGFPHFRCAVGFGKNEENRRLFKRMKAGPEHLPSEPRRMPSLQGEGDWDLMCGACTNVIVRGAESVVEGSVHCLMCGAENSEPKHRAYAMPFPVDPEFDSEIREQTEAELKLLARARLFETPQAIRQLAVSSRYDHDDNALRLSRDLFN